MRCVHYIAPLHCCGFAEKAKEVAVGRGGGKGGVAPALAKQYSNTQAASWDPSPKPSLKPAQQNQGPKVRQRLRRQRSNMMVVVQVSGTLSKHRAGKWLCCEHANSVSMVTTATTSRSTATASSSLDCFSVLVVLCAPDGEGGEGIDRTPLSATAAVLRGGGDCSWLGSICVLLGEWKR